MNHDDFVAGFVPNPWDALPEASHMIDAYNLLKKRVPMNEPAVTATEHTKLAFSGARACALAMMIADDGSCPIGLRKLARTVLRDWGISSEEPPEPEPAAATSDELVWPPVDLSGRPLTATLGPEYFKVFYRVREPVVNVSVHQPDETVGFRLTADYRLTLHEAYWDEGSYVWRMRLLSLDGRDLWMGHCNLRPAEKRPIEKQPDEKKEP